MASDDDRLATAEGFVSSIRTKEIKETLFIRWQNNELVYWKKKKGITPYLKHDTILEFDFLGFGPFTLYSLAITGLIVFPKPGVNLDYSTAS